MDETFQDQHIQVVDMDEQPTFCLDDNRSCSDRGINNERHQESFAMTHRESKDDLHSNNLFETLQGTIDQFSHNQMLVNANDYVSFKQTANNKTQFIIEGQKIESNQKSKEVMMNQR